jgi:hypothetical protein
VISLVLVVIADTLASRITGDHRDAGKTPAASRH